MNEIEKLINIAKLNGLTVSQLTKMTGLTRPTVESFMQQRDVRFSTYVTIRDALKEYTGNQAVGEEKSADEIIRNMGKANKFISANSEQEMIELASLRSKVDLLGQLLAEKDEVISALKGQIQLLKSRDNHGTTEG